MNHTFSAESLKVLNEAYDGDEKPSVESLLALSQQLNEPAKMIASWFRSRSVSFVMKQSPFLIEDQ